MNRTQILEADNAALTREIERLRACLWDVQAERNRLSDQLNWMKPMKTRPQKTPLPKPQPEPDKVAKQQNYVDPLAYQQLAQRNAMLESELAHARDLNERLSSKIMVQTVFGHVEVTSHGIQFLEKVALDNMAQVEKLKKEIEAIHADGGTI